MKAGKIFRCMVESLWVTRRSKYWFNVMVQGLVFHISFPLQLIRMFASLLLECRGRSRRIPSFSRGCLLGELIVVSLAFIEDHQ